MTTMLLDEPHLTSAPQRRLEELAARLGREDLDLVGSPDEVADRMVASIAQVSDAAWTELLGPVYTTASLQRFLGISRQAINQRVHELALLRLVTANSDAIYPAFQFGFEGSVVPGLKPVLRALAAGLNDPWTWAQWLVGPAAAGQRQIDLLWSGAVEEVTDQAKLTTAAWATGGNCN